MSAASPEGYMKEGLAPDKAPRSEDGCFFRLFGGLVNYNSTVKNPPSNLRGPWVFREP